MQDEEIDAKVGEDQWQIIGGTVEDSAMTPHVAICLHAAGGTYNSFQDGTVGTVG